MKQSKQDRRSRRTRQLLNDALVSLMREKRYDAITVGEILERANVGRSTFYAHFYDKDDLLVSGVEAMLAALGRSVAEDRSVSLFPSGILFGHVREHAALYQTLKRANRLDLLLATFQARLAADVELWLAQAVPPSRRAALPLAAAAAYVAGSFLALLRWWLEGDQPQSPAEMDAAFRALVVPSLAAAYGIDLLEPAR